MNRLLPSRQSIKTVEQSEIDYMTDRMLAIQGRAGNPEGVEIATFGGATAFYSRTMPWPSFNTVKGLTDAGILHVQSNNEVLHGRPGWTFFLAELDGTPAAAAVMFERNRIASLTFAATLPEFRGRGLHLALLNRRIAEASARGCELIVGQCAFSSQSHRNMEHAGMKLAYIRTAWTTTG
ncbi:GNAT family N-acetyltransferase [Saccharibacillus sp. CPCC 101409]|uniref:GNAT family N-acetyltransferase n=1 Tax=Saccharibacillus sp. CPCC 101409 TaxID=3058041 RepID=UPI0026716476|nr:GNAT family N-acetyltransferase [Saccharibacillus sp. CPCC 101409]MDO3412479.1 GNAT family N-acetyltransferase [Saccharibacillus sp. CPCC 101409]